MIKRILAITLAAIFVASVLASCAASPKAAIGANIRITSSDAESAAAWLTDRLGDALTDRVVIGTAADGYGVDVSTLEADGYFIRSLGDEVALFAKTASGLDRAARKYAKTVEAGSAVEDVTYHEGARIKRIELAGRDISEYTIYCEDEAHLKKGAAELSSLIGRACGVTLAVSVAEPAAPYITLRFVHDDALSTCGYRWSVSDDGLTVECSDGYRPTSPHFAVIRFLEDRLGWLGLTFGYEALPEADLVSVAAGESGGETNAFRYACPYGDQYSGYIGDAFDHTYGSHYGGFESTHLSGIPQCCHGLQNNKFGAAMSADPTHPWLLDQPCYLDEDFFEESYADIAAYIQTQLDSGRVIGENFFFVDIAAGDNGNWCGCKDCAKMWREEGNTPSASVVTWANRVTEALDEVYPGLAYGIFGYAGTNKPPKTVRANELIYVTYCFDHSCDMHAHDGSECLTVEGSYDVRKDHDNFTMSANLEGWLAMTENVYVWFYGMDQGFRTLSYVDTIRTDLRYFHEIGVKGFFWEAEDNGFSAGKIAKWMSSALTWDIGMSDGEYDAYLDRVLAAMYGDGGVYLKDYIRQVDAIQRNGSCADCWLSAEDTPTLIPKAIAGSFDTLFSLTEAAYANADTDRQAMRAAKLEANCIYQGCLSSYFDAYEAGDDERCAELSRRYALMCDHLAAHGIGGGSAANMFGDTTALWAGGVVPATMPFESDMEVMAWTSWKKFARHLSLTVPTRAMPDRVSEILAERES